MERIQSFVSLGGLKVSSASWVKFLMLKLSLYDQGRSIGSALIDMNFHRLISERLKKIQIYLKDDMETVADRMVHGRFERIKCSYGTAASALPTIPIEVPGLDPGSCFPDICIEGSKLILTIDELKALFDTQVDRMLDVIDEQFDRLEGNHPGVQVVWLSILDKLELC